MFLVEDKRHGTDLVFTWEDPRKAGYKGDVVERVSLDYDEDVQSGPDGQGRPETCVGRDPNNPSHYKVFKYSSDRQSEGTDSGYGRSYWKALQDVGSST